MARRTITLLLAPCLLWALLGCEGSTKDARSIPVSALRVGDVLGGGDDSDFARADHVRHFDFPTDHGKHPEFRSEWWYLTAVLRDADDNLYGVQFTIFRQALSPSALGKSAWQSGQAYLAHVALTDLQHNRHYADQRFARAHPEYADVRLGSEPLGSEPFGTQRAPTLRALTPLSARVADWSMDEVRSSDGKPQLRIRAASYAHSNREDTDFAIDLTFDFSRTPLLQGDRGLSKKGPGQASYYYSMPRMETAGSVEIDGRRLRVAGHTWMDREWSTSVLADGVSGWDWMALQLNDGRDIMAFRLRREDGERDPFDHGLLSAAGSTKTLHTADFDLEPLSYWRDEQGAAWPISWALNLASGERLQIDALVEDQVMDLGVIYWEGIVSVKNELEDILGYGYLELTGYRENSSANKGSTNHAQN